MHVSQIRFLLAALAVVGSSGCVSLEYTKSTGSSANDRVYQLNVPQPALTRAPKLSSILSTSASASAAAAAAASSSDYDAEWGIGFRAAPSVSTLSPGVTVHPMVSYTYFSFDGGHDDRFEAGGQVRKSMSGMRSRGFWIGGEAAYALFRTHIDKLDTENTNGWSVAFLLGLPVGDAVRNMSVYGGVGLADYGGSSYVAKIGLDWQPSFMKR